jgi:hypothetical protein
MGLVGIRPGQDSTNLNLSEQANETSKRVMPLRQPVAKETSTMTKFRLWGVIVLLALASSGPAPLHAEQAAADSRSDFRGATYLITVKTTAGAFESRVVITLHGDRTLSAIDAVQGGPTFFFTSQLGAWDEDGKGGVVGRTLDFDFPPNADVARLDYTFTFNSDRTTVAGTIRLTSFPLQGDPLDGGGTAEGTFTFTGTLVNPR